MLVAPVAEALNLATIVANGNAQIRLLTPLNNPGVWTPQTRQAYFDTNYPLPPSRAFLREMMSVNFIRDRMSDLAWQIPLLLLWPWLTFLSLMVFQMSMRRGNVWATHILRCVVYCGDAMIWYLLASILISLSMVSYILFTPSGLDYMLWQERIPMTLTLLLWLVRIDRLTAAYKR